MIKHKLYSVNEVCKYVGIHRSTFYRVHAECMNAHPDTKILKNGVSKRYTMRAIEDCMLRPPNIRIGFNPKRPSDPTSIQRKLPGLTE